LEAIGLGRQRLQATGKELMDLCERDLCVAHLLVSENARFDAVDGYATFQSSDALIVEADGEWQKAEQ